MRLIILLLILNTISCSGVGQNNVKKNESFSTRILFVNVSDNKPMSDTPPFVIMSYPDTIKNKLLEYISNREIVRYGKKEKFNLLLNTPKDYSLLYLYQLVNFAEVKIRNDYPDFNGDLIITFYFSSKGDNWLNIPSPPGN